MLTEEDLAVGRSKSFKNKDTNKLQKQTTKPNKKQTNAEVESIVQCFLFRLYPPLSNIQEISVQIAKKVGKHSVFDKRMCVHIKHNILW